MNRSDPDAERLLAYVDGELDAREAAKVQAQLAHDADAAEFVRRERALRAQLKAAFAPVLDEAVPDRIKALLEREPEARAAPVVDLGTERKRRTAPAAQRAAPPGWAWTTWAALAASVVVGIAIGQAWPLRPAARAQGPDWLALADGQLVARGALADALQRETAAQSQRAGAAARLGTSFLAQDGAYCRSFRLPPQSIAGLACRRAEQWQVQVLAATSGAGTAAAYRQAGSALPAPVLAAIDASIGDHAPLDAAGEAAALQHGWRREAPPATPGAR